ncbi:hypothetical protein BDU57DRAFT_513077 [Ampelomyces quisqualis]|uniref:Gamma interferon inducible lysosomal thiol reductase-domain-containing protein n=1 Tax=Ampelomyces quisqualis TaxID=50730 RepID=A0A6A5QVG2_AMPQU|nr:hypothetical protein BDU57DRAFT_513077 [Ampelomyces quisqualis]
MDAKAPLLPSSAPHGHGVAVDEATMRQKRKSRFQVAAAVILLGLFWLARTWNCDHEHMDAHTRVPLEIHIMSKCPDARDCLEQLVVPAMADVSDKVDFRLSFIGSLTDDDGVECKHGQTECLGNILMLCAASEYPDPKLYLGFSTCLINDYQEIPDKALIEDCALEHGLDFDTLNTCMSKDTGAHGMGLLRDSVQHSADVGVNTSCTVRLDDKVRCVYDGGERKDCDGGSRPADLVRDIDRLYDEAQGWTY